MGGKIPCYGGRIPGVIHNTQRGYWFDFFPVQVLPLLHYTEDRILAGLSNNTVTQSNKLIEASHTLTLNEKRLVLCAASRLDPRKPLPKNGFVVISADDFSSVFGLDRNHAYEALSDAASRLYNRDIKRVKDGKTVEQMRWVYHAKYKAGQGSVELGFSPTVLPHLTMLNREFTSYQLKQIGGLSSFYSIRLYELLFQCYKIGSRECTVERLREMLDLQDKYPAIKDMRRYVLDPAVIEVNSNTDLVISVEPKRMGRKIVGFVFTIQKNDQIPLPL